VGGARSARVVARRCCPITAPRGLANHVAQWHAALPLNPSVVQCTCDLLQSLHDADTGWVDDADLQRARAWYAVLGTTDPLTSLPVSAAPHPVATTPAPHGMLSRFPSCCVRTPGTSTWKSTPSILQAFCDFERFDVLVVLDYESADDQAYASTLFLRYGIRSVFQELPANSRAMFTSARAATHRLFSFGYLAAELGHAVPGRGRDVGCVVHP